VGVQPSVLAIIGPAATQYGIEARSASAHERLERRMTDVIRILTDTTEALRHLPPVIVSR